MTKCTVCGGDGAFMSITVHDAMDREPPEEVVPCEICSHEAVRVCEWCNRKVWVTATKYMDDVGSVCIGCLRYKELLGNFVKSLKLVGKDFDDVMRDRYN